MKLFSKLIVTNLLAITLCASFAFSATLVKDGHSNSTIVISKQANKYVRQSADMLSKYIKDISRAKVEQVYSLDKVKTPVTIWIGWSKDLHKAMPDISKPTKLGQVGIICKGNQLAIFGHNSMEDGHSIDKGTINAVVSFLQQDLGVRWLWPGKLGSYIPKMKTIVINNQNYSYTPQVKYRVFRLGNRVRSMKRGYYPASKFPKLRKYAKTLDNQDKQWLTHHHLNSPIVHISAGHAFTRWYKKYHQKHPDYFALQPDGTRKAYPHPKNVKLDISNPAVVKQWVDNAVKTLTKQPWRLAVSAAVDDGSYAGFDTSAATKAMDPKPGPNVPMVTLRWKGVKKKHVALTTRYVKFYNKLAEKLEKRLPSDRKFYISVYAYGALRTPPINVKLNKHVVVWFVGPIPFGSDKSRNKDKHMWGIWANNASHMIWRPNMYQHLHGMPGIFYKRAAKDFNFLAKHHMMGFNIDSIPGSWSTQGLQYYIMAKLVWNPYLDVEKVIDDYLNHAFGEAAAPIMRKYFNIMQEAQVEYANKTAGLHRYTAVDLFPKIYNNRWFAKLTNQLQVAKKAAKQESSTTKKQLVRLNFMRTGLGFMKAQITAIKTMRALRYGQGESMTGLAKNAVKATNHRDKLMKKQIGSHAIGMNYLLSHRYRKKMTSYLGPPNKTYLRLAKESDSKDFVALPMTWKFKLDPKNQGVEKQWYEKDIAKKLKWRKIRVGDWWDGQLKDNDPYDPTTHEYLGVAWYKIKFNANPPTEKEAWLHFGAVDEGCDVYLNGKLIAKQPYNAKVDSKAWEKPRQFNVTKILHNGENNLVVKVLNHVGKGGIYKPVSLRYLKPNLVPNGDFQHKMKDWKLHTGSSLSKKDIYTAFDNGKFVDRKSLRVHISAIKVSHPASIRTNRVKTTLKPGKYVLQVRYKEKLANVSSKVKAPIHIRLAPRPVKGKVNTKEYLWIKPSAVSTSNLETTWKTASGILNIKPKRPFGSFAVTIFFYQPGTYWIDNVSLHNIK